MVHKTSGAQKHLALLETALRLAHPWRYAENMAAGLERYWSGNEKAGKIVREMYELAGQVRAKIWAMGIPNLMLYIVITIAAVFIGDVIFSVRGVSLSSYLALFTQAAVHGQFWRFITFIFVPPTTSIISLVFLFVFLLFSG